MSPRISFSCDPCQPEEGVLQRNSSINSEFYFPIRRSFDLETSSADELFCDGKLLPLEMKRKIPSPSRKAYRPITREGATKSDSEEKKKKKIAVDEAKEKPRSKSYWRSRSLGCTSTFCPLSLLSRSNSTGSVKKEKKEASMASLIRDQRPPLKKSYGYYMKSKGSIGPVLNLPSPNVFGLGAVLLGGRSKAKK